MGYHEYRGSYLEYHGGYHDARGEYHDARGECHDGDIVYGDMSTVGGGSSLSSFQWTPRAPSRASYMYGTHHLTNYHQNSKSIGILWGFVWDPDKR